MKLIDLLGIIDENKRVNVYEFGSDRQLLAEYDGKDSIPSEFNQCDVASFVEYSTNLISIQVKIPTPTLAERLDHVMYQFDPYSYDSEECSVEEAERAIKENPESVIEELLNMLEIQMEG